MMDDRRCRVCGYTNYGTEAHNIYSCQAEIPEEHHAFEPLLSTVDLADARKACQACSGPWKVTVENSESPTLALILADHHAIQETTEDYSVKLRERVEVLAKKMEEEGSDGPSEFYARRLRETLNPQKDLVPRTKAERLKEARAAWFDANNACEKFGFVVGSKSLTELIKADKKLRAIEAEADKA